MGVQVVGQVGGAIFASLLEDACESDRGLGLSFTYIRVGGRQVGRASGRGSQVGGAGGRGRQGLRWLWLRGSALCTHCMPSLT